MLSLTGFRSLQGSDRAATWLQTYSLNPWTGLWTELHRGFAGISIGSQVFTDLDFADDVAVLSEMLEILILSLEILHYEQCYSSSQNHFSFSFYKV